ncbi:cysteine--tRNA ligase [Planctomycetia bacterium]|jgi:cysteinyl-tRNA synthetase|nr:cysteine--tRNA ligase [Planctomycetia bacterium]
MSMTDTGRTGATAGNGLPTIEIYSTLTRGKAPLVTVQPGHVGMYLCGPTVYKPSHIGHMVGPVIFDTVKRHLVYSGWRVTWVVNITDVDDKIIAESATRGTTMADLAAEMTADYLENLAALGVTGIDVMPKATEHIGTIIAFIEGLIARGQAYASDGDVYFDVTRDADYGKLTNRSVEQMQGEGGSTAERKKSAADFALWKRAKPGEPAWDSPWGPGRPGWHIECSAMSKALLGPHFDIHGGGLDLVFPHHENEIAQSESLHDCPMATFWMHNGLMQAAGAAGKVGGRPRGDAAGADDAAAQAATKISKSTGAEPFKNLLARHRPEAIRVLLLSTHYRSPIHFGEEPLGESARAMEAFERLFARYARISGRTFYGLACRDRRAGDAAVAAAGPDVGPLRDKFLAAMDDDFNTAIALATLYDLVRVVNKFIDQHGLEAKQPAAELATLDAMLLVLRELTGVLGLFLEPPRAQAGGADEGLVAKLMELVIEIRANARKAKDFATADLIRDRLTAAGIALEDRPGGTGWTRTS